MKSKPAKALSRATDSAEGEDHTNAIREGSIEDLKFDRNNANKGTERGNFLLRKSIQEHGVGRGIVTAADGTIIGGNHVTETLGELGIEKVVIVPTDGKTLVVTQRTDIQPGTKEFHELALLDNNVAKVNLNFDVQVLDGLGDKFDIDLNDLGFGDMGFGDLPNDPSGDKPKLTGEQQNEGGLSKRFTVPPFSILDTRQGYWKERKEIWRARIGDYGESRNATLRKSKSGDDPGYYRQKTAVERHLGRKLTAEEFERDHYQRTTKMPVGVSLLDPVLAEIIVQWFGVQGGNAFDCFAGDSVFGFVSSASGMTFTGIELRQEQADLNQARIDSEGLPGRYICDDGRNVAQHVEANSQDLLFSCPPYFDLEVYSDAPNDASNQSSYAEFFEILRSAFTSAVHCLKENRFAVIVVGDVRDKKTGAYYGFHLDIIKTMQTAGLHFYNECILIEQAGNAAIRASGQMKHRKVVKTHQQVLVFYKGDPRQIKNYFPEIVYEPEDLESCGVDTADEPDDTEEGTGRDADALDL